VGSEGQIINEVCDQLLDDIGRWSPELQTDIRSTLWHGVFTRAHQQVEAVLRACASALLVESDDTGPRIVSAVGGGKPVAALTIGQHVDLVRRLGGNLLSRNDRRLLDRLVQLRNDFVHGRLPREQGPAKTAEFLSLARELCQSGLVTGLTGGQS
jgi:hypothetical protein